MSNAATLARVCDHVDQVQQHLGCRLLLENPATYIEFSASTLDEAGFLAEVLGRTGCGLLLDLNNLWVSCSNHGRNPWAALAATAEHVLPVLLLLGLAARLSAAGLLGMTLVIQLAGLPRRLRHPRHLGGAAAVADGARAGGGVGGPLAGPTIWDALRSSRRCRGLAIPRPSACIKP